MRRCGQHPQDLEHGDYPQRRHDGRGGDDPSVFIRAPDDWFHNNACTYRKSDDSLIVSSRENFVICVDYETSAIKWILGDPTKAWYQYPSLRKFALTLGRDTYPPIGQHSVSITEDDSFRPQ